MNFDHFAQLFSLLISFDSNLGVLLSWTLYTYTYHYAHHIVCITTTMDSLLEKINGNGYSYSLSHSIDFLEQRSHLCAVSILSDIVLDVTAGPNPEWPLQVNVISGSHGIT